MTTTKVENNKLSLINDNKNFSIINDDKKTLIKTDYPVKISNFLFDKSSTYLTNGDLYLGDINASEEIRSMQDMYNKAFAEYKDVTAAFAIIYVKTYINTIGFGNNRQAQYGITINVYTSETDTLYAKSFLNIYLYDPSNKLIYSKKIDCALSKEEQRESNNYYYVTTSYTNKISGDYTYDNTFNTKRYEYTLRLEYSGRDDKNETELIKLSSKDEQKKVIAALAHVRI